MTYEEKIAAIDRYFDNISSEEFNRILEEKYGIPMTVDIEEGLVSSNNVCDVMSDCIRGIKNLKRIKALDGAAVTTATVAK